jgi:hypothetical protein
MKRKRIALALSLLFGVVVALQFIRPELPAAPVTGDLKAPDPVKQILRTACYNCHSNETRVPWFDQVVPAYWVVVKDVKEGRRRLNFSGFDALPAARQQGTLFEAVNQVQLGAMPPKSYEIVHPESRVTPQQLDVLKQYLASLTQKQAAVGESHDTPPGPQASADVPPAPNGIQFHPEYKDWRPISGTDRFDNQTIRAVLGNDAAIKAIASHQLNPWPDGTMFAKVAWARRADEAGDTQTGPFIQVEFMIKDSHKYAATKGWGFARWIGSGLKPYGKTAAFAEECVGCHNPMRDNDFVFTTPFKSGH